MTKVGYFTSTLAIDNGGVSIAIANLTILKIRKLTELVIRNSRVGGSILPQVRTKILCVGTRDWFKR